MKRPIKFMVDEPFGEEFNSQELNILAKSEDELDNYIHAELAKEAILD